MLGEGRVLLPGKEISVPIWPSCHHHGRGVEVSCYSLAKWMKSRLPIQPLQVQVGGRAAVFSAVFGRSRVVIIPMFSALLSCPFPGHLARENRLFLGHFCLLPQCFQVASFFSSKSVIYEAKNIFSFGALTTISFLGSEFPCWSAFFSLPFKVLCLFQIDCLRFLVVFSGRNRERYFYLIFLEVEAPPLNL